MNYDQLVAFVQGHFTDGLALVIGSVAASMYAHVAGTDMMGKVVIMGALNLYLDFINMFQFLLSFMGDRR